MVDVGAGDGHATVQLASRERATLAIALDATADSLRDGSRTALRRRLANTLFVVSAIEALPRELERRADEITVTFPWGSLLRGVACADPAVIRPLARLAKPGASVRVLLSVEAHDRASGIAPVDPPTLIGRAHEYASAGLAVVECRDARREDLLASGSSWAKRLGPERRVVALLLRRC